MEERKKAIMDAENDRRDYIVRKNQVRTKILFLINAFINSLSFFVGERLTNRD